MAATTIELANIDPEHARAEIGSTGLREFSGYVREEFHKDLQGNALARKLREMADNHPLISSTLASIDFFLSQVDFRVEATGETPEHAAAAEFIEGAIDDLERPFSEVVSEALEMMVYGWGWAEQLFKIRRGPMHPLADFNSAFSDGLWGWRNFGFRAQETLHKWNLDESGRVLSMVQLVDSSGEMNVIPRHKSLHFRMRTTKNNPEGKSMLRGCFTSYEKQRNMEFVEGIGVERNMAGIPTMQVPPAIMHPQAAAADKQIRTQMENLVQRIKVDEMAGLVLPSESWNGTETGYKFTLLSTSGKNTAEVDPIIRRYAQYIMTALQSEFKLVGLEKTGSFSLHDNKTDLFILAIAAILQRALNPFNHQAIPQLLLLNGMDPKVAPVIRHGDIETPDLVALATFISSMISFGAITPDNKLEEWIREESNLPAQEARAVDTQPAPEPGGGAESISAQITREEVEAAIESAALNADLDS